MTMSVKDCHYSAQNKSSKSGKPDGRPEQPESLGLSLSSQANNDTVVLNVDKLLGLFEGNQENVNYFIGLWNACKLNTTRLVEDGLDTNLNISDDEKCSVEVYNCDPRDLRKRGSIKDWSPRVTVSSEVQSGAGVDEGQQVNSSSLMRAVAADEDDDGVVERYAVKQTVFDHGGGGEENGDSMEQLPQDTDSQRFPCSVHGCGQVSSSLASYESHYHHCHSYVCDTCRRLFVSNFLLDIHLQENHDSYFAVLSPRIDMYRCLVESCDQKFRTSELRKDHLVATHKFPSSFSFHQPVKANRSKRAQKSSLSTHVDGNAGCEDDQSSVTSMEMDVELTPQPYSGGGGGAGGRRNDGDGATQSQKKKIPSSICFGRGSQRAFQQRRGRGFDRGNNYNRNKKGGNWYQQPVTSGGAGGEKEGGASVTDDTSVDIESVDMTDLADALSLPSN